MSDPPVVLEGRFTALSANVVYLEGAKFWIEGLDADEDAYLRLPPLLGKWLFCSFVKRAGNFVLLNSGAASNTASP